MRAGGGRDTGHVFHRQRVARLDLGHSADVVDHAADLVKRFWQQPAIDAFDLDVDVTGADLALAPFAAVAVVVVVFVILVLPCKKIVVEGLVLAVVVPVEP